MGWRLRALAVAWGVLAGVPGVAHGFTVTATETTVDLASAGGDQAAVTVAYTQGVRSDATSSYAQTIEVASSDGMTNGSPSQCETLNAFTVRCHLAHYTGGLDPGTAPTLTATVPFSLSLGATNELSAGQARPIIGTVNGNSGIVNINSPNVGPFTVDFSAASFAGRAVSGPANDTLKGGPGNDLFDLRTGDFDTVTGGGGRDTVAYFNATAGVTARLGGPAGDDALAADIEDLKGGLFADTLVGSDGPNKIDANNAGFAYLGSGEAGDTIDGKGGNDTLSAVTPVNFTQAPMTIAGGTGDDTVVALGGTSETHGDAGDDIIAVQAGSALVEGGADNDQVFHYVEDGQDDHSELHGGDGNDTVAYVGIVGEAVDGPVTVDLEAGTGGATGGPADTLTGFENASGFLGDDTLKGTAAANTLKGEGGNDMLIDGGGAGDKLIAGAGDDKIRSKDEQADEIDCGAGDDVDLDVDEADTLTACESSVVLITSGPSGTVTTSSVTFGFTLAVDLGEGEFECRMDSGSFSSCESPKSYSGLGDGQHNFEVRYKPDGQEASAATPRSFTVDTTAPTAVITSGPSGLGNGPDATFTFEAEGPLTGFLCSLDGAPETACASPVSYAGLIDGEHVFTVRAVDEAGNAQAAATTVRWSVTVNGECTARRGKLRACTANPAATNCPAGSVASVSFGSLVARSLDPTTCLATQRVDGRNVNVATGPVAVNGMRLAPIGPASKVVIDRALGGGSVRVVGSAVLTLGTLDITVGEWFSFDGLASAASGATRTLSIAEEVVTGAGLPMPSAKFEFSPDNGGQTVITLRLKVPRPFKPTPGPDGKDVSPSLTAEVPITVSSDKGVTFGVRVTLGEAYFGKFRLKNLTIGYDHATRALAGGFTLVIESPSQQILGQGRGNAEAGLELAFEIGPLTDGGPTVLRKARALISGIERYLAYGIYLQRGGVEYARTSADGVDTASFSLLGGWSLGPRVTFSPFFNGEIVSMDGQLTLALPGAFDPQSFSVTASGTAKLVDFPIANASITYTPPTDLKLVGNVDLTVSNYGVRAEIDDSWFSLYPSPGMNLWARGTINLPGGLGPAAEGVFSSTGFAFCFDLLGSRVGFGVQWLGPEGFLDGELFSDSCDLGPYAFARPSRRGVIEAGLQTFEVAADQRVVSILAPGLGAAPKVTVRGPGGVTLTTPADLEPLVTDSAVIVQDTEANATRIVIARPAAGRWTVEGATGPIGVARPHPRVRVQAGIVKRGARRVLRWKATDLDGASLQFVQRGGSAGGRVITTTKRRGGRVTFAPIDATTTARRVEALVVRNGLPQSRSVVTRFTVPRPAKPGRVRGLKRSRTAITWRRVAGARTYAVALERPGGPTLTRSPRAPKVALPKALRSAPKIVVIVTAVNTAGNPGRPVRRMLARPKR